jgi:hypothetical protein
MVTATAKVHWALIASIPGSITDVFLLTTTLRDSNHSPYYV